MTKKYSKKTLNDERRRIIRAVLDEAMQSVEKVKRLQVKLQQMDEQELEETVEICDDHREWAWVVQTQALVLLLAMRKKMKGGRGNKAGDSEGLEAFYEEWAAKLGRSKSWIRTNVAILSKHGSWSRWPPPSTEGKQAHTYYGSEAKIDDDEMFLEVRGDVGNALTVARFDPAPELRRAHYEASLVSSDPRGAADWARREILAGRSCTAKQLSQHIRSEEKRFRLEEERVGLGKLDDVWCDFDTRSLIAELSRTLGLKPGETVSRAMLLLRGQVEAAKFAA